MKTGAQLFTVRMYTQTEKDFAETIRRIAEMGYTTVQLSAIGAGLKPEWIRKVEADEIRNADLIHNPGPKADYYREHYPESWAIVEQENR